ncbi:MAG TPA: glycoside hydrolase family 18 protein [Terracidiphilus sp.]|jgi:chitinase
MLKLERIAREENSGGSVGRILVHAGLLALGGLCCCSALHAETSVQSPVIVAYVFPQDKALVDGDIAAQKLTRVNYAFANIKDGRIVDGFAHDDQNYAFLVALKQQNPSLTVLASVGGWLWSPAFSDMALTKQSRAVFIDSVVQFVQSHQLDGLDIDWEYPGLPGVEPHFRVEDKHNYTALVKELRKRFDKLEKQLHRPLYVTLATGSSQEFLDHTEMHKVQKYVDTVNMMAYDYYEPDSDAMTGHHAPLYTNPADPKKISDDSSIQMYEKAGVPAEKIVLGVPFYGHVWGQVPATNHGLYQPGKEVPHGYASYGKGPEEMLKNGFTRYWDSAASAPYLYNADKQIFVSYDDPESLALKCKYVLSHHLRGIMFWDYEGDSTGALLNAVNAGLGKSSGAESGGK